MLSPLVATVGSASLGPANRAGTKRHAPLPSAAPPQNLHADIADRPTQYDAGDRGKHDVLIIAADRPGGRLHTPADFQRAELEICRGKSRVCTSWAIASSPSSRCFCLFVDQICQRRGHGIRRTFERRHLVAVPYPDVGARGHHDFSLAGRRTDRRPTWSTLLVSCMPMYSAINSISRRNTGIQAGT